MRSRVDDLQGYAVCQRNAIEAAEHAPLQTHAALKEAARPDPTGGLRAQALYQRHELGLRRLASDLNEMHASSAKADYLASSKD